MELMKRVVAEPTAADWIARLTDSAPLLPMVTICAWCPNFNKLDPANQGASHGLCVVCAAKLQAEVEARS
jgi:hypothetical protein